VTPKVTSQDKAMNLKDILFFLILLFPTLKGSPHETQPNVQIQQQTVVLPQLRCAPAQHAGQPDARRDPPLTDDAVLLTTARLPLCDNE